MYDQFITLPDPTTVLFQAGPVALRIYALEIGPVLIRWYALGYIFGLLGGWWYARRLVANTSLWTVQPGTPAQLDDLLIWVTLGVVLGGRLGQVLLYAPGYYFANPWEIPQIWHGGMAFHGGLIGATLAIVVYAWANRIPVLSYLDVISAVAPFGIFLVRIANFINGELWGRETTDVPWAMIFSDPEAGGVPRHPSQLYEAATEGILLFVVLLALTRLGGLKRPGLIAGVFGLGYAAARSFCEQYREPDGWAIKELLTIGQAYSLPMAIIGIGLILNAFLRKPQPA
ncbi:prolipoprotein diacylglyceryl transferase [Labrys okinawensis]|uniref:prolipoprotein diacylglyceryl transferase n=1 Tax=Labrys okinawensis TaxID=346911 RepID=UPI0039BD60F7